MGKESPDNQPYSLEQLEATTRVLEALYGRIDTSPPPFLRIRDLQDWHRQLATPLGIRAGAWRTTPVTFGSYEGVAVPQIHQKIRKTFKTANAELHRLSSLSGEAQLKALIAVAAYVHARLIRIHPFEDGNGRVARLVLAAMFLAAGYDPPDLTTLHRSEYLAALNRYNYAGTDRIDCPALIPLRQVLVRLLE